MRDLEEKVKDYINLIISNISNSDDNEELFCLYKEYSGLLTVIEYNDLNIKLPEGTCDYIEDKVFDSIDFSMDFYNEFISVYDRFSEFNKKIGSCFESLKSNYDLPSLDIPIYEMDIDDSIKLVKKFLCFFNKEIFDYFNDYVLDKQLYYGYFSDGNIIDGFTLSLNSLCDNIVQVRKRNDIMFASNVIHESIHSFIESNLFHLKFNERIKRMFNNLEEVITYYSQLAFISYLKDINFDKESIDFLINDSSVRWIAYSSSMKKYSEMNFNEIVNVGFLDYLLDESVTYGTTMAYHYFDKYMKGEDVLDNLINLSLDSSFKDREELLTNYGIDGSKLCDFEYNKKLLLKYGNFDEKR